MVVANANPALGREVVRLLLDTTYRADPYPLYRRLREDNPVHRTPFKLWLITGHSEALEVLRDSRFSNNLGSVVGNPTTAIAGDGNLSRHLARLGSTLGTLVGYAGTGLVGLAPLLGRVALAGLRSRSNPAALGQVASQTLLLRDPPDHTRLRRLVVRAFSPRVVEALVPRIEKLVDELLAKAVARGSCDLMSAFAYPLPLTIICEMLGVPSIDQQQLIDWSREVVMGFDVVQTITNREALLRANHSITAIICYLTTLVESRRRFPTEDLISRFVLVSDEDDCLVDEEVVVMCALLLIAGHETTVNMIGNGLVALLQHPSAAERWLAEPNLTRTAIEELLRFDPSVQTATRRASENVEVAGCEIPAGDMVMVITGAANRDPKQFEHPETLILERDPNHHIAFGSGIHYCLGATLARAELKVAIPALLRRRPRQLEEQLRWRTTMMVRGLEALPVSLGQG